MMPGRVLRRLINFLTLQINGDWKGYDARKGITPRAYSFHSD